jgi:uncharacterized protein YdhG (YjbR/CyaY superfamily)
MARGGASTVDAYLAGLPAERREAMAEVRRVLLEHLPPGYEETIQYGMISYVVPRSRLARTYNGLPLAIASLASQKNYMSLYLMAVYGDPLTAAWFSRRFAESGKKLDMGKSCVRFRAVDELPLDVIGEAIARVPVDRYVALYEASRRSRRK